MNSKTNLQNKTLVARAASASCSLRSEEFDSALPQL